jgi:hypothetical protein
MMSRARRARWYLAAACLATIVVAANEFGGSAGDCGGRHDGVDYLACNTAVRVISVAAFGVAALLLAIAAAALVERLRR